MRSLLAVLAVALLVPPAGGAGAVRDASGYLLSRQQQGGGFAEPGRAPTPGLTAWAAIGLRAAGTPASALGETQGYLTAAAADLARLTDAELVLTALAKLGSPPSSLVARVRAARRPSGAIGPALNSTVWGIIALRAAGRRAPPGSIRYVLRHQHGSGGWSWAAGGAPDSNDTAAAVLALRAAGVSSKRRPVVRAVRYLRHLQNRDGGFELVRGRGSDAQSTSWAVQAFLAARARPGAAALRYLARLQRADGSVRYSGRYAVTPVWVTAQALPALARKPLSVG